MRKTKWPLSVVLAVLVVGSFAWAGLQVSTPVKISILCPGNSFCPPALNWGVATGAFGSARRSTDPRQRISCSIGQMANGPATAVCQAVDATGMFVSCQSTNPDFVATVRALTSDSYLGFSWRWNGSQPPEESCFSVEVMNGSSTEPK
jgi:hypothetical protein